VQSKNRGHEPWFRAADKVREALRLTRPPPPDLVGRLFGVLSCEADDRVAQQPLQEVPFAVLDLETTGLSPRTAEIIEIGICLVRSGKSEGAFATLVRPRQAIPARITALTGIDQDMVRDAPALGEVLDRALALLQGRVLVAHNAPFDLRFLEDACETHRKPRWSGPVVCTRRLARRVRPDLRRFALDDLCQAYDIPNPARHRARGDAEVTARLLVELLERARSLGCETLAELLALLREKPRSRVDLERHAFGPAFLAHLPATPGIYRMLDATGRVLYVGKARDLRTRVGSYFVGRARGRVAALREALHDVEVVPTGSEIEAILREAAEIRALRPPFNVVVQVHRRAFYLKVSRRTGRSRVVCVLSPTPGGDCFGPFIDPAGGKEAARLVRLAFSLEPPPGRLPVLPEAFLATGEGETTLLETVRVALASRMASGDLAGAAELRSALRVLRAIAATVAGPRRGTLRRDWVIRLPSSGAPKICILREGLPLEILEVGDARTGLETLVTRIESLLAEPTPRRLPVDDDALKLVDHWIAHVGRGAYLDLGDLADRHELRRRLGALLDAPPPADLGESIRY
jgi:DNA polymerase-3 subunit epsilon